MDRLIYTAYSGLSDSMISQQVIAGNMANAQTIGFRAEMLNHEATTLKGPSIEARAMTQGEARGANMKQGAVIETGNPLDIDDRANMKQGAVIETGNPLDIALSGRTMLAVQGEDGEEAYTRRGDLTIDASGVMSNGDGSRAAAEFVVNGEYIATDEGLPEARGQRYVLPGGTFLEVKASRITRITTYYNLRTWIALVSA